VAACHGTIIWTQQSDKKTKHLSNHKPGTFLQQRAKDEVLEKNYARSEKTQTRDTAAWVKLAFTRGETTGYLNQKKRGAIRVNKNWRTRKDG